MTAKAHTLHADMQLACVRQTRWMPGLISVTADEVIMDGWALSVWDQQDKLRFLVNGKPFDNIAWPLPSTDLAAVFPDIAGAAAARFHCRQSRHGRAWPFENGFTRFNVTSQFGEHAQSYRTAWYLADPTTEAPIPTPAQIARVIGAPDENAYLMGGATLVGRLDAYLAHRFGRGIAQFDSVLDWGCGAGRLTRYLTRLSNKVTGIDIDADNIGMCKRFLPGARFVAVDPHPPTSLANQSFDLVIGTSVLTHLDERSQHVWLGELRRIVRPGGLLLLTISGQAQAHLYGNTYSDRLAVHQTGFQLDGLNDQLDDVVSEKSYYKNVQHSHDYVWATWQAYFDVLEIEPGLACTQDLVVMRAR